MGAQSPESVAQAMRESKAIFERVGFRHIYERIEEMGVFTYPGKSIHESARAVPAELALAKLSKANAYN